MIDFQFADLHCHPNLKAFGHTFSKNKVRKKSSRMTFRYRPNRFKKMLQKVFGITKFSQADLVTMAEGNVKLAFVSLYPFEKGFFKNPFLNDRLVAVLSNFITSVGYDRIRYIQNHLDYFNDFMNEYYYILNEVASLPKNNQTNIWQLVTSKAQIERCITISDDHLIIPTIEGAHILNTGLGIFGKDTDEDEVLFNVAKLKSLKAPPFFITLAHNFNNDLCGHAPSLQPLGSLVDQSLNLNEGISRLGYKVIRKLLDHRNGAKILIDIKHMSLNTRQDYYKFLESEYSNSIPIIVSHGAVTGTNYEGEDGSSLSSDLFSQDTINFYDEELIEIAQSKGLFAIQFDAKRLAPKSAIKKSLFKNNRKALLRDSTQIIWNQLRHIAEVLDSHDLYVWDIACIGSDFDGTIDPLNEIWTSLDFNAMANELVILINEYLSSDHNLKNEKNFSVYPLDIVKKFTFLNAFDFTKRHYKVSDIRC